MLARGLGPVDMYLGFEQHSQYLSRTWHACSLDVLSWSVPALHLCSKQLSAFRVLQEEGGTVRLRRKASCLRYSRPQHQSLMFSYKALVPKRNRQRNCTCWPPKSSCGHPNGPKPKHNLHRYLHPSGYLVTPKALHAKSS